MEAVSDDLRECRPRPVSVLVVDDQPLPRRAVADVVRATDGFDLVGEAVSAADAERAANTLLPSLIVMDQRMPDGSGMEICRVITSAYPHIAVIICTADEPDSAAARAHGALRAIRKEQFSPAVLREVWEGRAHLR